MRARHDMRARHKQACITRRVLIARRAYASTTGVHMMRYIRNDAARIKHKCTAQTRVQYTRYGAGAQHDTRLSHCTHA